MKGIKRSFGVFVFVFLFSQMNLPEKVVNRSTYDYVVNLSKFSFVKYEFLEDVSANRLIDVYKSVYFDRKVITKRMRDMRGKRVYRKVEVLSPRSLPKGSSLPFVEKVFLQTPVDSPFRPDIALVYSDVLIQNSRYSTALKVLYSLSNTSVYDEALLRIGSIALKTKDYQLLKDVISHYEKLKNTEIYSPIYIVYKSILLARDGNVLESLNNIRNLVLFDFTYKYDYVNYIVDYFEEVSGIVKFDTLEFSKTIREICYDLIDYRFYDDAIKIALLSKIGPELVSDLILEMKIIGVKKWKSFLSYLPSHYRSIILTPTNFEKKLDNSYSNVVYKSLFVYYLDNNPYKSIEYLNLISRNSMYSSRVYFLASKLIDKLILKKDFYAITLLLDGMDIEENFRYKDVDRFIFFKGYAYEMLGNTNNAVAMYEKVISSVPSGYYDFLATRRISEIVDSREFRNYYNKFISPSTLEDQKLSLAKILYNFDKQNSENYKSFVLYKVRGTNPFLMDVPYQIIDNFDSIEKSKIKTLLEKISEEYFVVSRIVRNKMVYKGFSNVFSYIVVMRNRLEMKITRGIYNEGNNITANRFIDAYSKFLPFSIQEVLYPIPYVSDVIYSAQRFGVDPNLVYAVMKQESFFQEGAYSRAGAIGLMQVLYSTGKLVARKLDMREHISSRQDLFRSDLNIFLGTAYLAMLIDSYGDLNHAISAYNGGARVLSKTQKKYKISPEDSIVFSEFLAFRETRQYIKRVVKYYNVYSSIYNFDIVKKEFNISSEKDIEELRVKIKELQEKVGVSEKEMEEDED